MPIELELDAVQRRLTTHEGFKVDVRVRNSGFTPVEAPSLFDTSGALTFEVFSSTARRLRTMNGISQQTMLAGARPDGTPTLEDLPAGETLARSIDLAPYHYLLPAGDLRLRARYEYQPSQIRAFSPVIRIVVADPRLQGIDFWHEAGMLDSLLVILRARLGEQSAWFLRHYTFGSPLAAWYSERILEGETAQMVVCSTATFSYAETFDPVFERWIVWTNDGIVKGRLHRSGLATGDVRQTEVPLGWRLLPWSNHDRQGGPLLFFEAGPGRLECRRLESAGLLPVFAYDFAGNLISVRTDEESVHLLLERRGLVHEWLTRAGERTASRELFRSRLPLHSCDFEPFTGQVKALFQEGPQGGALELFGASLRTGETAHVRLDRLPLRHPLTELDYDLDRNGLAHFLAATSEGKLYYLGPNLGPMLVARGEGSFFPHLIAQRRVFLGYYGSGLGYRFCRFLHRGRPRIISFDEPY